ncbi:MAG TPA: ParB/RepB/Spo0J family partition protein [Clostridiales bacterium]|jgi:ParB family chromosome partitioning protein|nr:ParB/RepB/Spo0J family partition protein [Clostridiales bacterium]
MSVRKGLGRGLDALFSDNDYSERVIDTANQEAETEIEINKIFPNPNQPRRIFDEQSLNELADSIKIHGVIQPLIVTKREDKYMIIAGERRWRAASIAGLLKVPVIIKDYSDQKISEISLIENLQREDLNPIEAARAIKRLMVEYNYTQEKVAERLGKSRPAVANTLRLLTLDQEIIDMILDGRLSAGHARALLSIEDKNQQIKLAHTAIQKHMSVRDLENAVKKLLAPKPKPIAAMHQSIELRELIYDMQRVFATKVTVYGNENKGRIYIDYFSRDDLDRISELINSFKNR